VASINKYDKVRPKKISTGFAHARTKDGATQEGSPSNRGEVDIRKIDDKSGADWKVGTKLRSVVLRLQV
jgi:hypothetical protein